MAGEIFISYRRADEAWARLLHTRLQAEGIEAWYDALVGAGQDWRIATAKALEASQIFVLLFSENAAQSSDIAKELAAATLEKKLIIPVRLQNIAPKGAFLYELASRNWVNAYDNTETKLGELAKALAHLVRTGARDESVLPFERGQGGKLSPLQDIPARHPLFIAATAIIILASAIASWLLWPQARWTVETSRPFLASLALEDYPAFSPDGKSLAYTSAPDTQPHQIYVRSLAGGAGIKITNDAYDDVSPSWSSDGAHLAYIAQKPGEPCHIIVATVPGGETREVGRCRVHQVSQLTWQPGTSFLYYDDGPTFGGDTIFRLDLNTGARAEVAGRKPIWPISDMHASPDGKSLAYLWTDNRYAIGLVMLHDFASGTEKTLGMVSRTALGTWPDASAWTEDSKTILVSSSNGAGSQITAYPVDGAKPYSIYASATGIGRLAAGGGLLAVESDIGRRNLARASATPRAQPDIIDAASGITVSPTYAPDGTLAFVSNRSGTNAVWIEKPGAAPVLLYDAGIASLFRVNFSPDGSRLALVLTTNGFITVKVITAGGAPVTLFDMPSVGPGLPTWTPDGKSLIVFDVTTLRALRIAVDNPAQRTPVAAQGWISVVIRPDGVFATQIVKGGLWQIDKGERLITAKYPPVLSNLLTFQGDDVLVPDIKAEGGPRLLAQPLAGGPDRVAAYTPGASNGGPASTLAINPKTGDIVYVADVLRDTNIDLLTLAKH